MSMQQELFQYISEVFKRFQAIGLSCLSDAVKNSTCFGTGLCVGNTPVVLAYAEASDASFRVIII